MPYYHADVYNDQIKRKCVCGGDPEMLIDFVDDFIVRCGNCHVSTHAYMKPEEAIKHWDSGEGIMPPLDLLIDDLDNNLAGDVLYMVLHRDDVFQFNEQSCDCSEVIIVMRDRILVAVHEENGEEGAIGFDELSAFNEELYCFRVIPRQGSVFRFLKVRYASDGTVDGIKYQFGDRYLFISACGNGLVVTKSVYDLFEEDDTPMPDSDPSVLFE